MSAGSPHYQDPLETWSGKFTRKFKENPWVPLGCAATCGALIMSGVKMRGGRSTEMNHWLRARVVLQGATLVPLVWGSMSIRNSRQKKIEQMETGEAEGGPSELYGEKQKEREKEEFEKRLKDAQAITELEENAGLTALRTVKGPMVNNARREEEMQKQAAQAQGQHNPGGATTEAVKNKGGWQWWSSSKTSEPPSSTDSNSKS